MSPIFLDSFTNKIVNRFSVFLKTVSIPIAIYIIGLQSNRY